uniref:PGC-1 and ERR-induced regulator in muscle protein 1 n=1 Tax=Oryzias latipes TaxID=8090 RepID=A0A3P9JU23_ORYLA
MDDLDHSIHIAENDWSTFCDESEECDLQQPSLAYPDNCSLSDAEDSGNSTSVVQQQQQLTQRGPDANCDGRESNTTEGTVSEQPDKSGCVLDVATHVKLVETCGWRPGGDAFSAEETDSEGTIKTGTGALQADSINNQSSGAGKDEYLQTKSDQNSPRELDPTPCNRDLQNVNEPDTTGMMEVKVEKDRWFVTVNEKPWRQRGHSSTLKKKRQPKSTNEGSRLRSSGSNADKEKTKTESNARKDTELKQSQSLGNKQTVNLVEKRAVFQEETTNTCKPGHTAWTLMEDKLCHESEDFFSHSSEAAQSAEDSSLHDLFMENQLFQSSLLLPGDGLEPSSTNNSDQTNGGQMQSSDRTLSSTSTAGADTPLACSSAAQETSDGRGEDATCTNNRYSGTQSPPTESLPAAPPGDGLDPTQVLAPAPDSPERHARAEGNTRPVYAISTFWDHMEKLTINDILHLRMGASRAPRQDPEVPHGDDVTDAGETADSDYFTQSDESKPEQAGCEFSTSDFEEEYWQHVGVGRNVSPDSDSETQQSCFVSGDDTNSEGGATPVPLEEVPGQHLDSQEPQTFFMGPQQMKKSKSFFNISSLVGEASPLLSLLDNNGGSLSLCTFQNFEENKDFIVNSLETPVCSPLFCMDVPPIHHQMSFSETFQYFFTDTEAKVQHLTFPKQSYAPMNSDSEELEKVSPISTASYSVLQAGPHGASAADAGGSCWWRSLRSLRMIGFLDKGSIWSGRSGVWNFPAVAPRGGRAFPASPEVFRGDGEPQKVTQTFWTTKGEILASAGGDQHGIFSSVKQSDMCLVCIAFASWVLKSSDPDAADAWKAALLANVSALSAIQYLRHYVKKKAPLSDHL